jgi:hypothetical protein
VVTLRERECNQRRTADWSAKVEPVPYAKLDNPQSLNLYAYVNNNPITGLDPDGHEGSCVSTDWGCNSWSANSEQTMAAVAAQHGTVQQVQAQQQNTNQPVGNTTEGSLAKVLTNEDGSLSTPKKGDPQELVDGKTALANAIYNNANLAHPEKVDRRLSGSTAVEQSSKIVL